MGYVEEITTETTLSADSAQSTKVVDVPELKSDAHIAAERFKAEGNDYLKEGELDEAITAYGNALDEIELDADGAVAAEADKRLVSVLFANRSEAFYRKNEYSSARLDALEAIKVDHTYWKGFLRLYRAEEQLADFTAAKDALENLFEAAPDQKVGFLLKEHNRIEKLVEEKFEKDKAELLEKAKGFGNWALGKVGLSLDNFKLQQNEQGSYNIEFVQTPQSENSNVNVNFSSGA